MQIVPYGSYKEGSSLWFNPWFLFQYN
jgi:hypothetical protein